MTVEHTIGTRAQVWHGTAKKTSGGLTKKALMMNKHGRIVSRRKHASGKKSIKNLEKLGYKAKKGQFTLFRKGRKGSKKMRGGAVAHHAMNAHHTTGSAHHSMVGHKMKGGMVLGGPLSPLSYDGQGVGTSGVNLQFVAGNAA